MKKLLTSLCLLAATAMLCAGELVFSGQPLKIELVDRIKFPVYSWTPTLLSYPVKFAGAFKPEKLVLLDGEGKQVPVQWSEVGKDRATLNFISDLPSGGVKTFTLQNGVPEKFATPAMLSAAFPKTEKFAAPVHEAPGPFSMLKKPDGKRGFGVSTLRSPKLGIASVESKVTDDGPLFKRVSVEYAFENGGKYTVVMRFVKDYDFFDFDEDITGIGKDAQVKMIVKWQDFPLDYRFGTESHFIFDDLKGPWPGIDEQIVLGGISEEPHWCSTTFEDVSKEMYMYLSPYCGNSVRELFPCMSFWQKDGDEIGIFVRDYEKWRDPEYGIWQPTHDLMVRFAYKDKVLDWIFPVSEGGRSCGINYQPAAKGEAFANERWTSYPKHIPRIAASGRFIYNDRIRYNQFLSQLYGPQSLDRVKDWVLTYSGTMPKVKLPPLNKYKSADDFEKSVLSSSFMFYPLGQNSWPGVNSIDHRFVYGSLLEGYLQFMPRLSEEKQERINAVLLYAAYLLTGEAMHPVLNSLAGCPNMAADGWTVPALISYLFPDHPRSKEWRDHFQKYWAVSTVFFTRPDVKTYDSAGGRWTESLGIYNIAHLNPTMPAQAVGYVTDGINRIANHATALRAHWMTQAVSSPVLNPNPAWRTDWRKGQPTPPDLTGVKPLRQNPSIGAHGMGSTQPVPAAMRYVGYFLRNYDPMASEYLLNADATNWRERTRSTDVEGTFLAEKIGDNKGTDPELESGKFTGYGINFRYGVGTDKEVFLYLSQVDDGPNYRWGNSSIGSTGALYYTAANKVWTGHEIESTGDHYSNDADGHTNFGVMKNQAYRSVGHNVLEAPFFDLGVAQLGTLKPRKGEDAYASPEYVSRSLMLVGGDYFLLQDVALSNVRGMRFSWFIPRDGEYPDFFFLSPSQARPDHWQEVTTRVSKGFYRDHQGGGCHQVIVSHRKGELKLPEYTRIKIPFLSVPIDNLRPRKRQYQNQVFKVETPESSDVILRYSKKFDYEEKNLAFKGDAGVVRRGKDGSLELACFGEGKLSADGVGMEVDSENAAASVVLRNGAVSGRIVVCGDKPAKIKFNFGEAKGKFYLDGVEHASDEFAPGKYFYEYTASLPTPSRPAIVRTENVSGGAKVFFNASNAADKYTLEVSSDNGATWKAAASGKASPLTVSGLENGKKAHLRVVGANAEKSSRPSKPYPLYVTSGTPEHPDGLLLELADGAATATWGECLGVTNYSLYRRVKGSDKWEKIYSGMERTFTDRAPELVKPCRLPGSVYNKAPYSGKVYEYCVAAANANGEGEKSEAVNSDPTSWLNWQPPVPLKFRRRSEFTRPPYSKPGEEPPLFYPD